MMIEPLHIHRGDMLRGVETRGKEGGVRRLGGDDSECATTMSARQR